MFRVEQADSRSNHYAAVLALWKTNKADLGFLPWGAFEAYADDGKVLVALTDRGACAGYLLYREVRGWAVIVHLCVAAEARGRGAAKALHKRLVTETGKFRGIRLTCRTDFAAHALWPKLGYTAAGRERPGKAGALQEWAVLHDHRDLFSDLEEPAALRAAVDTSVFIDLQDDSSDESRGLTADWLRPFVVLCFTSELALDLRRGGGDGRPQPDPATFTPLDCTVAAFQAAEAVLAPVFAARRSERDRSDFRHLVRAAGAGADAFVTRDEGILDRADEVFEAVGLAVVRPSELVVQIDILLRERLYQWRQVAGTNQVRKRRLVGLREVVRAIKANEETVGAVAGVLNGFLADPKRYACHEVGDAGEAPLAAYVTERRGDVAAVVFFRVADGPRRQSLVRKLLHEIVSEAAGAGCAAVACEAREADPAALRELGFLPAATGSVRYLLRGWLPVGEARAAISGGEPAAEHVRSLLAAAATDPAAASAAEHLIGPARLSDAKLPCYIVPIDPAFASDLFAPALRRGSLFGTHEELALNVEAAYYRAAVPRVLTAPSRVLWYVKRDGDFTGTKAIRACSRIVEVVTDAPKPLFKRFRHLGVYRWSQVYGTAANDTGKTMMAFRFDDTQLLRPVPWDTFQRILGLHGMPKNYLQSPVEIPAAAFGAIYAAGLDPAPVR